MTEQAPAAPANAGQAADGQGANNGAPANANAGAPAGAQNNGAGPASEKAWYDGHNLAAEDVGYIQNKGWKTPVDMLTSYKNSEKFLGVPADQLLKLPKDMSDTAAMNDVYARLGRPAKAEEYGFKAPEGAPAIDANRMGWFDKVAHGLGLSKGQHAQLATATMQYEGEVIKAHYEALEAKQTQELEGLKKEWGNTFPQREELGRRAIRTFLPGDAAAKNELMNSVENAIGTAAMLKLFSNIGEQVGQDKLPTPDGERPYGKTQEQIKADIKSLKDEIGGDNKRLAAYNEGKGADYQKMQNLLKQANAS